QAEDGIRDRNVTGVQTCALPIFGLGSGSNITRSLRLLTGSDAGRLGGQSCARRHNPDIDTWSFRPRLSHSFSYCHHRQNIAADCKHPSDTKPEKLGEPLSCGSIAADQSPARHTFLPIVRTTDHKSARSSVLFLIIGARPHVRATGQLRHRLWRNWRTSVLEKQPSTTAEEKLLLRQDVSDGLEGFFSKVAFACECGHSGDSSEVFFHIT